MLLLDEPFAAVDWALRESLRHELATLRRQAVAHVVLVTHDFDDVAKLASHLVVLEHGAVSAAGTVEDLTSRNAVPGSAARANPPSRSTRSVVAQDPDRQSHAIWLRCVASRGAGDAGAGRDRRCASSSAHAR